MKSLNEVLLCSAMKTILCANCLFFIFSNSGINCIGNVNPCGTCVKVFQRQPWSWFSLLSSNKQLEPTFWKCKTDIVKVKVVFDIVKVKVVFDIVKLKVVFGSERLKIWKDILYPGLLLWAPTKNSFGLVWEALILHLKQIQRDKLRRKKSFQHHQTKVRAGFVEHWVRKTWSFLETKSTEQAISLKILFSFFF